MVNKNSLKVSVILFFIISFIVSNGFAQCPWVEGVLVNACSSSEGLDEMVNFQTGSSPLSINSLGITFATAGNWCNSGCGGNTWANGTTYFNASVKNDCTAPGVFINVNNTSGTIPANSQVLVFTSQNPTFDYDFSSLCNFGPFYIVFATNASTGGRFSNTATTPRNITLTDNGSCSQTVSYTASGNLSNMDGDYVRYNQSGTPTYMNLASCVYAPSAFPLAFSFMSFGVTENPVSKYIYLRWQVKPSFSYSRFEVLRSDDGVSFESIGFVIPKHASSFSFIDEKPLTKAYYCIHAYHSDGSVEKSSVLLQTANEGESMVSIQAIQGELSLKFNSKTAYSGAFEVVDPLGKIIYSSTFEVVAGTFESSFSIPVLPAGVYLVRVETLSGFVCKKVLLD